MGSREERIDGHSRGEARAAYRSRRRRQSGRLLMSGTATICAPRDCRLAPLRVSNDIVRRCLRKYAQRAPRAISWRPLFTAIQVMATMPKPETVKRGAIQRRKNPCADAASECSSKVFCSDLKSSGWLVGCVLVRSRESIWAEAAFIEPMDRSQRRWRCSDQRSSTGAWPRQRHVHLIVFIADIDPCPRSVKNANRYEGHAIDHHALPAARNSK